MAQLISADSISQAWEASLGLFDTSTDLLRFNSQRGPCSEIQDVLFDIKLSAPDRDISSWYPLEFHSLVDGYSSGFLNENKGRDSTIAERLYRWEARSNPNDRIDQVDRALRLLAQHPNTRYNVLSFWDPAKDVDLSNPVSPLVAHLQVRRNKLSGTLFARTVDAWLGGFPMLVGFARLVRRLAMEAGAQAECMRVLAGSYHVYEMDLPILQSIWRRR
jgi:thymidylate synthase